MEDEKRFGIDREVVRMAFDAVLTIVVGTVGFIVIGIRDDIRDLRLKDVAQDQSMALLRERLPIDYVRMEAYTRDVSEIKSILMRIETRVESKADRQQRAVP